MPPSSSERLVLGIDPGTANLGLALVDAATQSLVRAATYSIGSQQMCRANETYVVQRTAAVLKAFLRTDVPVAVVVERNLRVINNRALDVQGCGVLGHFCALGIAAHMVSPIAVRQHFGLECTGNHHANKAAPQALVRTRGVLGCDNHQADAVLLAFYWIEVTGSGDDKYSEH